ncbi:MAG: arsenical pump-driving ATPase [Elainellaceae cyanobacterium]
MKGKPRYIGLSFYKICPNAVSLPLAGILTISGFAFPDSAAAAAMNDFDRLHLALFSGKGGVGKTTLSCAFARHWAQQYPNQTILLLSTDPAHSLADVLQMPIADAPQPIAGLPNLRVRALDAEKLLQTFRREYGQVLELLVERGSFVQGDDLSPVWDLGWPGLDELMGILEIQRILREQEADRVVVDMAPSGHSLNLFGLMDFLDRFLEALALFQEKHRVISQSLTGRCSDDEADAFLTTMKADLATGRQLLQDATRTACLIVAIAEPMSYLETRRFLEALAQLQIPCGGLFVNRLRSAPEDCSVEQQEMLQKFLALAEPQPVWAVPLQAEEPVGMAALDRLFAQVKVPEVSTEPLREPALASFPEKILPSFSDFIGEGRRLILVGGKGGVGKTTISAAIAWGMAAQYPDRQVRVISIDPAHSLGDALGIGLGHSPTALTPNLTGQEIDADQVLDQFREEYLWELAEMISGETGDEALQLAYGPEAWRQIVSQALPGIDEMLSLIAVIDLLEAGEQDLIVLDTAPTGHLLRFLEMPTALADWLAWIFKLWIKYQDVVGRTDLISRLRTLRQRVVQAQKKLKDPNHTEFIGVVQAQTAIVAEAERLCQSLTTMGISQRYLVHNRYQPGQTLLTAQFPQAIVHLPELPRSIPALNQIQGAAQLLF